MSSFAVRGQIRRRLLVNYRVDPDVMQQQIPRTFQPKLHNGYAVAGICLIRLERMTPHWLPLDAGLSSENAAHRVAVIWTDESGHRQEGVYIPRRDSDSWVNCAVGGRLFPGHHQRADFETDESGSRLNIRLRSRDHEVAVDVKARRSEQLPETSIFSSISDASGFFEAGCIGYSPSRGGQKLEGVLLKTATWSVAPLAVDHVFSSYFADESRFPAGSVAFDCALLMERVVHEWVPIDSMPGVGR